MHSRFIGPLEVSSIGLGCMNFSMGYGPADDAVSTRLLNEALDVGYRFLDTASMYGWGHNEQVIGNALKTRRQEYVLASKCGFSRNENGNSYEDGRPETVKRQCEESLKRLQTDMIDLYYLHRRDKQVPIEESVGALADLVAEGKIRAFGLSEISTETLRRANAESPVTAVQSEYSLWSRTPEFSLLDACTELGVAFVPFSPLGRGFLTGAAKDVSELIESDLRATIARPRFEVENYAQNAKLLIPYAAIAERLNCTMGQLALAWLLAKKDAAGNTTLVPIPGTKHVDFMKENAAAGDITLDEATVVELNNLINESTVIGTRYTKDRMASSDSEQDRPAVS